MAKAGAADDKMLLVNLLASMYTPRARSRQNLLIEGDIKKLVASSDLGLAAQATFAYSRLGYPADRYEVLQRARATKILDDDSYYGELAHGLRFASPTLQSQMLAEMDAARNGYGAEVLAFTFGSEQIVTQLEPALRAPAGPDDEERAEFPARARQLRRWNASFSPRVFSGAACELSYSSTLPSSKTSALTITVNADVTSTRQESACRMQYCHLRRWAA